jgi:hypothetical protein
MKKEENSEDYVWRFRLDGEATSGKVRDPMMEMVRGFLADFLQIGFLTKNGARVDADGFVFSANPDLIHKIFTEKKT